MRGADTGATNWVMRGGDHDAAIAQKARARIVQGLDDVFFERVVAERFGHDDVDARRILEFGRMARVDLAVLRAIGLEHLGRDARHLGGFKQQHLARAELGCHQPQQSRARANVGDRALAGHDHALQGLEEGLVTHFVGDERAVIFDAHEGSQFQMRSADVIERQRGGNRQIETVERAAHGNLDAPRGGA